MTSLRAADNTVTDASAVQGIAGEPSRARKILVLMMLTLVYVFLVLDRQIVGILATPIKHELRLTDTQLGMMGGLAFSICYCTLTIPIARLADLHSRSLVITLSVGLWSLMTALCGLAQNFTQLFLARVSVGVGEAGGLAPSCSLITDYFPPRQRARALGVFSFAVPIGSAVSAVFGGAVVTYVNWRWAFVATGVAGLLIVGPFRLIVKEPPRGRYDKAAPSPGRFMDIARLASRKPTFWAISLGGGCSAAMTYGAMFWLPAFFIRSFGLSVLNGAMIFAVVQLVGGVTGCALGGVIADRARHQGRRGYTLIPALAFLAAAPSYVAGLWTRDLSIASALLCIPTALAYVWLGPTLTAVQHLAPSNMRTTMSALYLTISNLFGLIIGTVVLGALSDLLAHRFGAQSLRYSIIAGTSVYLVAAPLFFIACRTIDRDWVD